ELVMQVWACRQAGHADIADHLALADVAANADARSVAAHVGIEGLVGLAELDHHGISVAALASDMNHSSVASGLDRGAGGGSVINTFVGTDLVQHRVHAAGVEARADAGELHRGTDERLAHAGAVSPIVAAVTFRVGVAHGSVGLAPVGEARG